MVKRRANVIVTEVASVPNRTSNTVDKFIYHIPQGLMWSKLIG